MANNTAVKALRQEIQRLRDLRDAVHTDLLNRKAQMDALKVDQDAFDAQIADNQAAILLLGG